GGGVRRRGAAADGRIHVGLDLGLAQRAVVDPYVVHDALEELADGRVAADREGIGVGIGWAGGRGVAGDEHAVGVGLEGLAVIGGGRVVPGIGGGGATAGGGPSAAPPPAGCALGSEV